MNWAADRRNRQDVPYPQGMSHSRRVIAAAFASVSLLSPLARAEQDPWSARVRALSDAPLATFQGVDCVSIRAPRDIVWRLLVAPEYAATWFFADSPNLKARGARYKKGPTAEKGDGTPKRGAPLPREAPPREAPRHPALWVIVPAPPDMLSFLVRSDDADL